MELWSEKRLGREGRRDKVDKAFMFQALDGGLDGPPPKPISGPADDVLFSLESIVKPFS
jgi:hypothetical protein